jgi:Ni,Fe-hydrogenase III large subunit
MYLEIRNNQTVNKADIPIDSFKHIKKDLDFKKMRVVQFFVNPENGKNRLYCVFTGNEITPKEAKLFVVSCYVENSFESITIDNPALHLFEREIYENFGIKPIEHPWLKPVRNQHNYEFLKSDDMQTHEVAVGPVHAGIIEPGHFRFLCNSERINHLEVQLGYQHRGVEKLLKIKPSIQLAESICGDSTIAYALTFAHAIESLSNIKVDKKADIIRQIVLELERIAIHIGDLGGIAEDIAYKMGSAVFGVTRTLVINTMLEICGNRFGKGLIKIGGVNFDIDNEMSEKILSMFDEVLKRVDKMMKAMNNNTSVLSRLEKTAIISTKHAKEIGMVGMAARACNIKIDARKFDDENFEILTTGGGDVHSRFYIRYVEIKKSKQIIENLLKKLIIDFASESRLGFPAQHQKNLKPNSFVTSVTESWRGELIHTVITDEEGNIETYKIKDPSFNNWLGVAIANRNGQISNFPVCNKSFDLSYCGFDL